MECVRCGFNNRPEAKFCNQCGNPAPAPQQFRVHPDTIYCLNCGNKSSAGTACMHCNTISATIPLGAIQRFIDMVRDENNQEARISAIHALGKFKVRLSVPILLDITRAKGFKYDEEPAIAKYALTQIFDLSVSYITCSICKNEAPATAKFCGYCGAPVTRPVFSQQQFTAALQQIQNYSDVFPIQAVRILGQAQSHVATPILLEFLKKLKKGFTDKFELLVVLEALTDIADPATIAEIHKTACQFSSAMFPVTVSCVQSLYRLGAQKEVEGLLRGTIRPHTDDGKGRNLLYVLKFGELYSDTSQIEWLTQQISEEHKKWRPEIGFAFFFFDPVTLIISTVLNSFNILLQSYLIEQDKQQAKTMAAWMVIPAMLNPFEFETLPGQVRLMMALHCYSAAFARLAWRDQTAIQRELQRCKKPIEQAVISFALAQNGHATVTPMLTKLLKNRDWAVRVIAYEGLIALSNTTEALQALQDSDLRVRIAVAQAMAGYNPFYVPYILPLADSTDNKQRLAMVSVIAQLARAGVPAATVKLQQLANDQDKKVRGLASTQINQLMIKSK